MADGDRMRATLLVVLVVLALTGCGRKGDLYLPEPPPPNPEQTLDD